MLRIDNLSKRYGDHQVFQGLNLSLPPGCHALCEEENTGKSTLLNLIAGILKPDTGDIWIDGHSLAQAPAQTKARLAFVPQQCLGLPGLTGRQFLEQAARQKKVSLSEEALDLAQALGLAPHLDKLFEQMSTGTRRKVYLAAAALGNPAVIIADGPSDGLDAPARGVLAEQFKRWSQNRVVLFASHDVQLVEACGAKKVTLAEPA